MAQDTLNGGKYRGDGSFGVILGIVETPRHCLSSTGPSSSSEARYTQMPFTIDFLDDGRVLEWDATADNAVTTEHNDYTPRFYVGARNPDANINHTPLQSIYDQHPDVVATEMVTGHLGFRRDEEPVLAVDVSHINRVTSLAQQARQLNAYPVGDLACFDVDPTPARSRSISEK